MRFFRTAALVNKLSEAKKGGNLSPFLKKLNKAEVIILDEYGYVPLDRTGAQLLFEIISDCYERKSIILNLNSRAFIPMKVRSRQGRYTVLFAS